MLKTILIFFTSSLISYAGVDCTMISGVKKVIANSSGTGVDYVCNSDCKSTFQSALNSINSSGGGTLCVDEGNYTFLYSGGNPTMTVYDDTTVALENGATLYSQVGPGGDFGYNTCLFVNSNQTLNATGGNSNIEFKGGTYKVESPAFKITGDVTSSSNKITNVSSLSGIEINQGVHGPGIPAGSVIQSINTSTNELTISKNVTSSGVAKTIQVGWSGGPFICMVSVDGFKMNGGIRLMDVEGMDALSGWLGFRTILSVTNFEIDNVELGYESKTLSQASDFGQEDGLHFYGGTSDGIIKNIKGTAGDDVIALDVHHSISGVECSLCEKDIKNVIIDNVAAKSEWAQIIRLIVTNDNDNDPSGSYGEIFNIDIRNIYGVGNSKGSNTGSNGIVFDNECVPISGTDCNSIYSIHDIYMKDIFIDASNVGRSGIEMLSVKDIIVENLSVIKPNYHGVSICNGDGVDLVNSNLTTANRTSGKAGILIDVNSLCANEGSSDIRVLGGEIANQLGHGITMNSVSNSDSSSSPGVEGLILENNSDYAVHLGASTGFYVQNNYFAWNKNGSVQQNGSSNTITSNESQYNSSSGYGAARAANDGYVEAVGRNGTVSRDWSNMGEIEYWGEQIALGNATKTTVINALKDILDNNDSTAEGLREETVNRAYQEGLNRNAETSELSYWNDQLKNFGKTFITIKDAIKQAIEDTPTSHEGIIENAYNNSLGRLPTTSEESYWDSVLDGGETNYKTIINAIKQAIIQNPWSKREIVDRAYYDNYSINPQSTDSEANCWLRRVRSGEIYENVDNVLAGGTRLEADSASASEDFGATNTDTTRTYIVKNIGSVSSGALATNFEEHLGIGNWELITDNCSNTTLDTSSTCTILVKFKGSTGTGGTELSSAVLSVSDSACSANTFNLSGKKT